MTAVALAVALAFGYANAPAAPPASVVAEKWEAQLHEIDELLVAGNSGKAYSRSSALAREMIQTLTGGDGATQFLGVAIVLRAIASHQVGREQEASWHWQVAVQLFPELAEYKMSAYGDTREFLRSHMPRGSDNPPHNVFGKAPGIEPAELSRSPAPRLPMARHRTLGLGARPQVFINVVVGEDGSLRDPVIGGTSGNPVLVAAALEAARDWKCRPARKDGQPVATFMTIKVGFSAP